MVSGMPLIEHPDRIDEVVNRIFRDDADKPRLHIKLPDGRMLTIELSGVHDAMDDTLLAAVQDIYEGVSRCPKCGHSPEDDQA